MNPLQRRVKLGTETDPLQILKQVSNPTHLHQPKHDLMIFAQNLPQPQYRKPRVEYSHAYDKNAAYIGVASSVQLGIGEPTYIHLGSAENSITFWSDAPGIWKIDTTHSWVKPLDIVPEEISWQYTPVVKYLLETNQHFRILEACYFPDSRAVLKPFYQYIKEYRERDREGSKEIYTHLWGLLNHKTPKTYPGYVWRPDWLGTIIAENKVRIHRQAMKAYSETGSYPVGWRVDCLYYDRSVPYFEERIGTGIGEWKYEKRLS